MANEIFLKLQGQRCHGDVQQGEGEARRQGDVDRVLRPDAGAQVRLDGGGHAQVGRAEKEGQGRRRRLGR